jgi:LysR family glycine cleavage system transcriptional activator
VSRLPPFFALRALEAAARHRSYSRAARELSVTHGAVSQQIRRLEAELGARLFHRSGNAMIPTPEAARLAAGVTKGLGVLQNAVAEFAAAAERDPLVVSLDPQFANRWLPSRLQRLLADPAGANLEFRVEERIANFVTDGADIGIRYGAGHWPDVEIRCLFRETLFPVCTARLAAELQIERPQDLLRAPLLHGFRPWSLWFAAFRLLPPRQSGLFFDDSAMLLEAAAQGLGVALARSGISEGDLAAGRLVRPLEGVVASELGFFAVWRADSRKLTRIERLADWLAAEALAPGGDQGVDQAP